MTEAVAMALAQGAGQAANVGGTLLNNWFNKRENQRTRNWNLKMWNLENEYNTPVNQMKRFSEAGLNPNLIYGQGSAGNAGSVSSVAPYRADPIRFNFPEVMSVLQGFANYKLTEEELYKKRFDTMNSKMQLIKNYMNNVQEYGDSYPSIGVFGKGVMGTVEIEGEKDNSRAAIRKDQEIRLNEVKIEMDKALKRIRDSEATMSESLKNYNMSAADPLWARLLMKVLQDTDSESRRNKNVRGGGGSW